MHLVTFEWADGVTDAQVAELNEALGALWPTVPGLVSYRHGRDLGLREGTVDYGICAVLPDPASLPGYLDHPEHRRIAGELIAPMTARRQAVQIEVPEEAG